MRALVIASLIAGVATVHAQLPTEFEKDRKPTFQTGGNVLIKGGRVLTVTQGFLDGYDVLIRDGKIAQVGKGIAAPSGVRVIDAKGLFVTPGIVDAHSHRGSDDPGVNEGGNSITAEVRMADVLNPSLTDLYTALASGMTTGLLLHGSANPVGGESLVIKHKFDRTPQEAIFRGAPKMVKFALGENPKSNPSGENPRFPATRMGVEAIIRRGLTDARDYIRVWDEYEKVRSDRRIAPPRRDLRLEALADILRGKTWVQCHSYRQDEMLMIVRLSEEFGFKLVLQHALESYKIAPELAKAKIPVSIFGGGFGYKLEVMDSTPMAAAILDKAGVLVSINTDTSSGTVPLTQDAGRSMRYGVSEDRALRMITINPAIQLGVDKRVGSIEVGKDGDIAIWKGHPLSTYTKCAMTLIEGEMYFERRDAFKVDAMSMQPATVSSNPHDPTQNPRLPSATSYLISGATVHPVSSAIQRNSNVLIENGRIVAVGPSVKGKSGTVTVDARGMHVYPGFIDAGGRPGLDEIGQIPQAQDAAENGAWKPDIRAFNSINPESQHLPKAFTHGVTSIFVTPQGGTVQGQAALINTAGFTTEALALEPLAGLMVEVPTGIDPRFRDFYAPEEIERQESSLKERQKILVEYFENAKRYLDAKDAGENRLSDLKLDAMRPYVNGLKPVFFLANSPAAIRKAVELTKQFKLKGVVVGGAEAFRVAKLLKDSNMPVILSAPAIACPSADDVPAEFDPYDTKLAAPEVLRKAGVKFCLMTNSFDENFNLANQVGRLCAFGLSQEAAVRAITLDAAEILGVSNLLGSLDAGKLGNVIVTDGDPFEMSTQVRYAFVNGKPVPMESRYTELWRKYMGRVLGQ